MLTAVHAQGACVYACGGGTTAPIPAISVRAATAHAPALASKRRLDGASHAIAAGQGTAWGVLALADQRGALGEVIELTVAAGQCEQDHKPAHGMEGDTSIPHDATERGFR